MFEAKAAMFLYSVSPVHMGAGTALGAIDNPIQRERHTGHPILAGSGLKGALRDVARERLGDAVTKILFGPEPESNDRHAGALSVSDAQIVLFPVRSLRRSYVYTTCPTAIERLKRLLLLANVKDAEQLTVPNPKSDDEVVLDNRDLLAGDSLVLETFAFKQAQQGAVEKAATTLAQLAIDGCPGADHFAHKIARDLVVLSDTRFAYFVRNATVVEPHVRIDDATGTADDGGLFYTENIPPESLFVSLLMASAARSGNPKKSASDVLQDMRNFDRQLVQVGGDATTGRGQMLIKIAVGEA